MAAKQWLTFTSGSPLQPAVAHALDHEAAYPTDLARDLQRRRDLLCEGLAEAGLAPRVPEGTYFATTDTRALGWADGRAFCEALPERAGVVAIPSQAFYDDQDEGRHLVRWAFCKQPDVIAEGVRRLRGAELRA
jgi:N-succinyldiaminopimelate aminotransferase